MKLSEIFGKSLSSYDSWNGDHKVIKVENITITDDSKEIIFSGRGYWGNEQKIYVDIDRVDQLLEIGFITKSSTIDHCSVAKEIKFI